MNQNTSTAHAPAIILFGSPGSGKGTQAKLLRRCISGPHISTGDMLRTHIEAGDQVGKESEGLLKTGKLVPDEWVNELVEKRIAEPECRAGVILDGYPRTLNQARVLMDLLARSGFRPAVIHLVVDYEKIVARLSGRRQCPVCGTLYSLKTNPPKVTGICDLDGAALVTREDDRESVIRQRLSEYESLTRPLLDFFRKAGVPMFEINGAGAAPEVISGQVCSLLESSGLTANGSGVGDPQASVMS
ncbi:MAG TPA: nucleoside monophosphate kinase [Bryobacteraceae bacterium]|nr:nucleoside monophosphate kinase [Bryobacteraceae bacterium]